MDNVMNVEMKFKELIKYIASRSISDEYFGATKLNKILFFCDFLAYRDLGKSISGEGYHKEPFGPVPNHINKAIKEMKSSNDIAEVNCPLGSYTQRKIVSLTDVDLDIFSPREISLIDNVIDSLRGATATEVSDLSHKFIGWQLAEQGEDIPYEVSLLSETTVTEDDIEYGNALLKELENNSVLT